MIKKKEKTSGVFSGGIRTLKLLLSSVNVSITQLGNRDLLVMWGRLKSCVSVVTETIAVSGIAEYIRPQISGRPQRPWPQLPLVLGLGAPLKNSHRLSDFLMEVSFTDMKVPLVKDKWRCPFENEI